MKRWKVSILGLLIASFLLITVGCEPPVSTLANPEPGPISDQGSGECNRECLIGFLNSYLDALTANDPARLNLAGTVKYSDNGLEAQLGDGLWQTAVSVDNDKRLDFADPVQGNVASQVVIYEEVPADETTGGCGGTTGEGLSPVIYQVRLKVAEGQITEIEAMTVRRQNAANGFFNVNNMKPEPVFLEPVPTEKRMTREQMKEILDVYVDYLEGTAKGQEVPFAQGCKRYENGFVTASGVAAFNMQNMWRFKVTRRYPVIDEETGIIWGQLPFFQSDYTLVVGEAFKIVDGKIMMIQAVMNWQQAKYWD